MATYQVKSALLLRTRAVLGVTRVSDEPPDGRVLALAVEGDRRRRIKVTAGRHAPDDRISDPEILIIEAPAFPVPELIGRRLIPVAGDPIA